MHNDLIMTIMFMIIALQYFNLIGISVMNILLAPKPVSLQL